MYWDTEKNNYFSGLYVLGQLKKYLFLGVPIHRIITVLVKRLGGLSLPRKSVKLTVPTRPQLSTVVIKQQHNNKSNIEAKE